MAVREQKEAHEQNDTYGYGCFFIAMQEMVRNHMFAKYDLSNVKLMAVGGDGGSWVGSSFNLCGIKHIEHVLDPFHIKRAIRTAFSYALELSPVYDSLFHDGFSAIADHYVL